MIGVFDIEADNLYHDITEIHCVSIKIDNDPTEVYTSRDIPGSGGTLEEGWKLLQDCDLIVGHNIINFDIPAIYKMTGIDLYKTCDVLDTMLISQLLYPNILMMDMKRHFSKYPPKLKGKHGLKAWGYRLGMMKGNYGEAEDAWHVLTKEMVEYCRQDTNVTHRLYQKFQQKGLPPIKAIDIEQRFARIIARQIHYGWLFDQEKAKEMHIELLGDIDLAEAELFKVFQPMKTWFPKNYPKIDYKKNGEKSQVLLNQEADGCHFNDDLEWGYWKDVAFNPGSSEHIVKWVETLYGEQDWIRNEPTDKHPLGSPKTGAEHLERMFGHYSWSYHLLKYLILTKLLGQLATGDKSWMKHVKDDGRIHGGVSTLGAVSRRCTHSNPNMAQVPSVKKDAKLSPELALFKEELGGRCRALFVVPKGRKLLGCDADALELRTLSHFMSRYDNGAYALAVDQGNKDEGTDIHTLNQKGAGLPTRDDAKTFIYAFLYGAGDAKIGSIIDGSKKEGKALKTKFLTKIPAIKKLGDAVVDTVTKSGYLKAIDGNPFFIRSKHSALNTLLQGAGALVMKYWLVEADDALIEMGFENSWTSMHKEGVIEEYEWVGNIHDEGQMEADEEIAEEIAEVLEDSFRVITEELDFRIPLKGTADIGDSWYDTH